MRELRLACRPVQPGETFPFSTFGVLPNGRPLFADGSTTCSTCNALRMAVHLNKSGECLDCVSARITARQQEVKQRARARRAVRAEERAQAAATGKRAVALGGVK